MSGVKNSKFSVEYTEIHLQHMLYFTKTWQLDSIMDCWCFCYWSQMASLSPIGHYRSWWPFLILWRAPEVHPRNNIVFYLYVTLKSSAVFFIFMQMIHSCTFLFILMSWTDYMLSITVFMTSRTRWTKNSFVHKCWQTNISIIAPFLFVKTVQQSLGSLEDHAIPTYNIQGFPVLFWQRSTEYVNSLRTTITTTTWSNHLGFI